jgi:hypothetical protein
VLVTVGDIGEQGSAKTVLSKLLKAQIDNFLVDAGESMDSFMLGAFAKNLDTIEPSDKPR